ncbi:MAG: ABC-type transport system involved in multi-copper enzyme maturation permease subunit [Natronomonas sp.]|jgi:ABC-type transport system involved in multi-copper enzyme maturation permease subunit
MSWRDVAHKNVRDSGRSRTVWLLFAILSILFVGYAVGHGYLGEDSFVAFLDGLVGIVGTFIPALGVLLGYRSISDDRESGSLLLELSFPHSRRDLIVGTFVGRTIVLVVPTLVALAVAGIVGAFQYGTGGALWYPWFLFVTALYGAAFVGVSMGLSMATTSDRRITFGAVGGYLLLASLWSGLVSFGFSVIHRFGIPGNVTIPDWGLLLQLAGPSESFFRLMRAGFDLDRAGRYVGEGTPVYVDWWGALLLLALWIVVPLVLGFRRFRTADL